MDGPPGGLTLEIEAMLAAPPEQVFRCLTVPELLAGWWGPHGFTTPEIDLDLRVGGHYRLTMQPLVGAAFHLAGEFLEVEPPERLAYTFRWEEPVPDDRETVVVLGLQVAGDTTRLSLRQDGFATEERVDLHRSGWTDSLEKLRELLAQR